MNGADLDVIIRQSLGCLVFRITFEGALEKDSGQDERDDNKTDDDRPDSPQTMSVAFYSCASS